MKHLEHEEKLLNKMEIDGLNENDDEDDEEEDEININNNNESDETAEMKKKRLLDRGGNCVAKLKLTKSASMLAREKMKNKKQNVIPELDTYSVNTSLTPKNTHFSNSSPENSSQASNNSNNNSNSSSNNNLDSGEEGSNSILSNNSLLTFPNNNNNNNIEHVYDDGNDDFYIQNDDGGDGSDSDSSTSNKVLAQLSGFSVMDRTVQPPQRMMTSLISGKPTTPGRLRRRASLKKASSLYEKSPSSSSSSSSFLQPSPLRRTRSKSDGDDDIHSSGGGGDVNSDDITGINTGVNRALNMNEDDSIAHIEDFRPVLKHDSNDDHTLKSSTQRHASLHHQYHPSHHIVDTEVKLPSSGSANNIINNNNPTSSKMGLGKMVKSTSMSNFYYKNSKNN